MTAAEQRKTVERIQDILAQIGDANDLNEVAGTEEKTAKIIFDTVTGKQAIINKVSLTEIKISVPEVGYTWTGMPLPGDTKKNHELMAGRVALTAEVAARLRDELSVATYEIGDHLAGWTVKGTPYSMVDFMRAQR